MELILLSVLLAIIQGLTEFLPISSSAHLLLPSLIFGFQDLGLSFDIATHVGTLTAVIYFFRKEIYSMILSLNPKSNNHDDRKLTLFLCISLLSSTQREGDLCEPNCNELLSAQSKKR